VAEEKELDTWTAIEEVEDSADEDQVETAGLITKRNTISHA